MNLYDFIWICVDFIWIHMDSEWFCTILCDFAWFCNTHAGTGVYQEIQTWLPTTKEAHQGAESICRAGREDSRHLDLSGSRGRSGRLPSSYVEAWARYLGNPSREITIQYSEPTHVDYNINPAAPKPKPGAKRVTIKPLAPAHSPATENRVAKMKCPQCEGWGVKIHPSGAENSECDHTVALCAEMIAYFQKVYPEFGQTPASTAGGSNEPPPFAVPRPGAVLATWPAEALIYSEAMRTCKESGHAGSMKKEMLGTTTKSCSTESSMVPWQHGKREMERFSSWRRASTSGLSTLSHGSRRTTITGRRNFLLGSSCVWSTTRSTICRGTT